MTPFTATLKRPCAVCARPLILWMAGGYAVAVCPVCDTGSGVTTEPGGSSQWQRRMHRREGRSIL